MTGSGNPLDLYLGTLRENSRWTVWSGAKACLALHLDLWPTDAVVGGFEWWTLSYADLSNIRTKLIEKYPASTASLYLTCLKGILKACWRLGYLTFEDFKRLTDLEPVPQGRDALPGRSLTLEEIQAVFGTCRSGSIIDDRDAAIFAVLLSTGLRRSELIQLNRSSVERHLFPTGEGYRLRVTSAKGGGHRFAYVGPEAAEHLDRWLPHHLFPLGPLFYGVTTHRRLGGQAVANIIWQRAEKAGIPPIHPHDLRRTFITRLLEAGADLATVSRLAGHKALSTTMLYDRREDDLLGNIAANISFRG